MQMTMQVASKPAPQKKNKIEISTNKSSKLIISKTKLNLECKAIYECLLVEVKRN